MASVYALLGHVVSLTHIPILFVLGFYGVKMAPPLWRQWIPDRETIEENLRLHGRGIG